MSFIKRISTTISAQIDQVLGDIENHEALIKAAIQEQRKKYAAAKVQLARLQGDEQQLKQRVAELTLKSQQWQQRALREAAEHEDKALYCLQQKQNVDTEIQRLQHMQQDYAKAIQQMQASMQQCLQALQQAEQQQQLMKARQTSADAITVIDGLDNQQQHTMQETMRRWETKILTQELTNESLSLQPELDTQEQMYIAEEQQDDLKQALADLLASQGNDKTQGGA